MADLALSSQGRAVSWRTEAMATFVLAWPMILTNLVEMALTTTDVMMMGQLGPAALSAGILATNFYFCLAIPGLALVSAVSPLIAREKGGRPHAVREVRRSVRQGLWSTVILSAIAMAVLSQTATIMRFLGQQAGLADMADDYIGALMWSLPAFLGYIVLRSTVAALGRPRAALWAALIAIPVNGLLAYGLMFGRLGLPDLGLRGGGEVATCIATWVMFAMLALQLVTDRRLRRYRFFGRWWQADPERLVQLWRIGAPIAVAVTFEVTIFNAAAFLMGLVGQTALAAHAIAIQICSLTFMVPLGLGQAATVRVGHAFGAGDRPGIARAGRVAFIMGVGFMVMTATIMLLAPKLLASLFVDVSDPANHEVIALAVIFLFFGGIFQIADGAQVVAAGMLRGLHDTRVPMLFAGLGYWVIGLPLAILLGFGLGLGGAGIWSALALGLAVVAVLMTRRWMRRVRLGLMD